MLNQKISGLERKPAYHHHRGSATRTFSDKFCNRRALVGSFLFLGRVTHRQRVQHLEFMEYNMLKTIYFDFGLWPVLCPVQNNTVANTIG